MPSRPPLGAVLSGGLLSFLAPSYRATPVLRPSPSRSATARSASGLNSPSIRSGRSGAGSGGGERAGERRQLSGQAQARRREQAPIEGDWTFPVASTSAVRIDPPSPFSSLPAGLAVPLSVKAAGKRRADDHESSTAPESDPAALSSTLTRLRELHSSTPDASPAALVHQMRFSPPLYHDDDARERPPPTPPPPIRLDPQPHSSASPLLTPFLLQALFLSASALGLLARRKVQRPEEAAVEVREKEHDRARRQAEERVDELQALDLLVGALAVPEASGVEAVEDVWQWRKEKLQPLLGVVRTIQAEKLAVDRTAIASVLHFFATRPPSVAAVDAKAVQRYEQARPVLVEWASNAFEALKEAEMSAKADVLPAPSSVSPLDILRPEDDPSPPPPTLFSSPSVASAQPSPPPPILISDDLILRSLLSVVYQNGEGRALPRQRRIDLDAKTCSADRRILATVSDRVLASPEASSALLQDLAQAAVRATRPDILEDVRQLRSSPSFRLFAAGRALDLYARGGTLSQNEREAVACAVGDLEEAVAQLERFGEGELDRVHWALVRLMEGVLGDVAAEKSLRRIAVKALAVDPAAVAAHPRLLVDLLKHLVRSRHPRFATRVLLSIPREVRNLEHYEAVLRSSHLETARRAWTILASHPTLEPQLSTFIAFLRAHAHSDAPPVETFSSYQDLVAHMRRLKVPFTLEAHHLVLRVLVRHGSDPALRRHVRHMREKDGLEPTAETLAILATREMVRLDRQCRTTFAIEAYGERARHTVELPRRRGGRGQMKRVANAVREVQAVEAAEREGKEDKERATGGSFGTNILLKNLTRWTREVDAARLVEITKGQLGIDLSPLAPSPSPSPSASPSRYARRPQPTILSPLPASALTYTHYATARRPAYMLLAKAFEQRGERERAGALRRLAHEEGKAVGRKERERKREGREEKKRREAEEGGKGGGKAE
ncbi:hypothetical protein JCM6882_007059 [Rhodosporidiobolus microsporus]